MTKIICGKDAFLQLKNILWWKVGRIIFPGFKIPGKREKYFQNLGISRNSTIFFECSQIHLPFSRAHFFKYCLKARKAFWTFNLQFCCSDCCILKYSFLKIKFCKKLVFLSAKNMLWFFKSWYHRKNWLN